MGMKTSHKQTQLLLVYRFALMGGGERGHAKLVKVGKYIIMGRSGL
jgi:hypothetical protein